MSTGSLFLCVHMAAARQITCRWSGFLYTINKWIIIESFSWLQWLLSWGLGFDSPALSDAHFETSYVWSKRNCSGNIPLPHITLSLNATGTYSLFYHDSAGMLARERGNEFSVPCGVISTGVWQVYNDTWLIDRITVKIIESSSALPP